MDLSTYGLVPLTLKHKPRFDSIINNHNTLLSSYSFISHYIWRNHFNYHWGIIAGHLCLFARYGDYIYMPIPPVSAEISQSKPMPLPSMLPLEAVFNIMDAVNYNRTVSRIENIDESCLEYFAAAGCSIKSGEPEYVYLSEDLSRLKGDHYKSKRAMCNYFEKHYKYIYEPFKTWHAPQCIDLYNSWKQKKIKKTNDPFHNAILDDSYMIHREVITNHDSLGISGRVVKIDDRVEGYIFGYERNKDIFYVLLEVTNTGVKGLAQFIFREFCKEKTGHAYINALGDSGLENLRNVKLSYRPFCLTPSFTAYMG